MPAASDRTQHVIAAIDGALEDWSVGPDAMRWTPETEARRGAPTPGVWHRPGCSIVHEYLDRPPACQCGALDRAALTCSDTDIGWAPVVWENLGRRRGHDRLSITRADTAPTAAEERAELEHLVDDMHVHVDGARGVDVVAFARVYLVGGRGFGRTARQAARIADLAEETGFALTEWQADFLARCFEPGEDDRGGEDPRARALQSRQQRSTGPARSPAGQQRRPRRLN